MFSDATMIRTLIRRILKPLNLATFFFTDAKPKAPLKSTESAYLITANSTVTEQNDACDICRVMKITRFLSVNPNYSFAVYP